MYLLIFGALLIASIFLLWHGAGRRRWWEIGVGLLLLVATPLFFKLLSVWGDLLWFQALGYGSRFWTALGARVTAALVMGVTGAMIVGLLMLAVPPLQKSARLWSVAAGAVVGGLWGLNNWASILKFWYAVPTGTIDPIFQHDASFYLFRLPLLDSLGWLLLLLTIIAVFGTLVSLFDLKRVASASRSGDQFNIADLTDSSLSQALPAFQIAGGAFVLTIAFRTYLAAFDLMYSRYGAVHGPGWTDVHVRRPAYYVVAALFAIAGLTLLFEALFRRIRRSHLSRRRVWITVSPLAIAAASWLLGLVLLPTLVQWLYVQPNELTVERPYIEHNIQFTRQAFGLDQMDERQFPVSDEFSKSVADENAEVLSEVRLWDPRALDAVYQQFQEIRLYYQFVDVDVDRYTIDGQYRQVLVSAREMDALNNLPPQNQTFVNQRFKYTHGYGLTMAPVSEFTPNGLPNLLIKDIPPKTTSPDLAVSRPEVYYGELTDSHVIVNTRAEEFDYPSGEHNVYTRYAGDGGVALSSLWRKFAYGWKFDGTRLFVSNYITQDSRIMFHRQIHKRLRVLAPFLHFDEDAYIVLDQGKLYWIVDAYTTSDDYPYSEPFLSWETTSYERDNQEYSLQSQAAKYLRNSNYVRNSVKAVINAFDGSVSFYVFAPDDPLIQVWQRIFPDLFKPQEELPSSLRDHVRYPEGLLLAQGMVYARYHMTDPNVFYNQEDIWVRATEKYYGNVQPVEPYYVMWKPPNGKEDMEFILMLPFTPKNRQVLIGWIAGMSDGDNYGRLLAYRFPKEKRVLGTQQVETKIDQDPILSRRLSLWDQRGSRVVRGNVLAIPVTDTMLYVEPIYLQADAAAYPELRLVIVMHNDQLSYADNFEDALKGLYAEGEAEIPTAVAGPTDRTWSELATRASQAFDDYLQSLGRKDFEQANEDLKTLSSTLEQLDTAME